MAFFPAGSFIKDQVPFASSANISFFIASIYLGSFIASEKSLGSLLKVIAAKNA